ncbi:MAG: hypothetical protein Barrevirus37_8 [Barrevirus sp.]|uniref:Uncharacterized protein n=1 Tax=Barrevirus sp. TaxID=2487763 RepID=A0A3G4ZV76_9VIRU|nr:MAG: hypothetical protein Barrevirus37_8 [Barrevirus sp.]
MRMYNLVSSDRFDPVLLLTTFALASSVIPLLAPPFIIL